MSEDTNQESLIAKLAGLHGSIDELIGERVKPKQQFFYVVLQDNTGKIVDIGHYTDYETALMRGMDKAKEAGASWSIFSLAGKFIDGNYVSTK